jgi:hypothetical protein
MKKSNFALRLQPSLMEEARKVAKAEGVAMNQLINVGRGRESVRLAHRGVLRRACGQGQRGKGSSDSEACRRRKTADGWRRVTDSAALSIGKIDRSDCIQEPLRIWSRTAARFERRRADQCVNEAWKEMSAAGDILLAAPVTKMTPHRLNP